MSIVSGSAFITAMVEGDQVTATLSSTKPLSQYVKKGTSGVSPDWTVEANQPIVYVVARSQNTGLRKTIQPESEEWSYNGLKIEFNASGVSTFPSYVAGKFLKTVHNDGDNDVPALKIIGNLASPDNTDNDQITFKGNVEIGGIARPLEPSITVRIEETVGDPYDGYIDATDGGVIDDDTASVTLTAHLLRGGNSITTGVSYKWSKAILGGWQEINASGGTPNKITLSAADIDSSAIIKCEFYVDNVLVFTETRPVYDETDPLVMAMNPSQSTQLKENESVTFGPTIHRRSTGAKESGYDKFSFTAYDIESNLISLPVSQVTDKTCKVTYVDATGIGKGSVRLYVSTAN